MTDDVIEIRLPPKARYLPVLRATIGVIAGAMSFNYDEIIQVRAAASEAFDMAIKYLTAGEGVSEVRELDVRFVVAPGKLEISFPVPEDYSYPGRLDIEEEKQSEALLKSLMDELEFGAGEAGKPLIRMVKYKRAGAV